MRTGGHPRDVRDGFGKMLVDCKCHPANPLYRGLVANATKRGFPLPMLWLQGLWISLAANRQRKA